MRILQIIAIVGCACSTLAGCAHGPALVGGAGLSVAPQSRELPAPERQDLDGDERPYLVGPMDKLTIDVYGLPDLSKYEVQIDGGGEISVPLVGVMHAAGLTTAELGTKIATGLRGHGVRDPSVAVNLKEGVSQTITVDGDVREPGNYQIASKTSLMRAIATAKGGSEFANFNNVVVFRTVGGQRMAALYNVKSIRKGIYADPDVYPNDIVVVGDNAARRALREVGQIAPAILTPLVYILTR